MKLSDQLLVAHHLQRTLRSQWWPAQRIREYQERALVQMMRFAASHVPFYRALNLRAETLTCAADLGRFPIISKRDVQSRAEEFLAEGSTPGTLHASRTSGSSGQPTTTYFDRDAWLMGKYVLKMRRLMATGGLKLGRRILIVSEQTPERLGGLATAAPSGLGLFRQRYVSIHTRTEEHLAELTRYRPHVLYAFPSYLLDVITVAERLGQSIPQIDTLYTSSEVLTPAARSQIEHSFGGQIYDIYGSTEFKEVAWQCRDGCYHLNFENVHLESRTPGSCGPVVLSTLDNHAMPLLRFDMGDRAVFGSNSCACGRASLQLLEFDGREGDMIKIPGGRSVSPYLLTTAIETENSILQYRINQTDARSFRVDVIVKSPGDSSRWHARVCRQLEQVLGAGVSLAIREVARLERDASGKRSVFVRAPAGVA